MSASLRRREFLAASAAAGTAFLGAGAARAGGLKGYLDVPPELFQGINRVKDPGQKNMLEKKHAPVIEVPGRISMGEPFQVKVTVGEVVHPMSAEHYIQYAQLLAGNEPAGRADFSFAVGVPQVVFTIRLDKPITLVVREYCNLHGLWESRLDVSPA